MSQKSIILIIGIILSLVGGMFWFAYLEKTNSDVGILQGEPPEPVDTQKKVTVTHTYQEGVHTLVGNLLVPRECDEIQIETSVAESMPEQIFYDLTIQKSIIPCREVATLKSFKVQASASEGASHRMRINKTFVQLEIIDENGSTEESFE